MSVKNAISARLDEAWGLPILDANGMPIGGMVQSLQAERDRARRLERESPLAYGILDRATENVIGTGIVVRPRSSSADFNARATELWGEWWNGKACDIRRMHSGPQLQRLAYRSKIRDGDCGFVLVDRTARGYRFPELQFVQGEQLDSPSRRLLNRSLINIADGIEYDAVNSPIAYHLRTRDRTGRRVAARDFVYLHNAVNYNAARGISRFQGTYDYFDQLDGHIEAVVVAARIAASNAMIARKKSPHLETNALPRTARVDTPGGTTLQPAKAIHAGMINYIGVDEELTQFKPEQPHTGFAEFVVAVARLLGLKFGLTIERILLDFSGANYSVSRSTALQEQKFAEPEQQEFDASFLRRVYPWFISKCQQLGYFDGIDVPDDAWDYEWIPQARPLVEPTKDAAGWQRMIAMGITSPSLLMSEQGWDSEKVYQAIEADKAKFEEMGLPYPGTPAGPVQGSEGARAGPARDGDNDGVPNEDD